MLYRRCHPLDIMLMSPGDNGLTGRSFEIADYRDALIELCIEKDLKFIDLKEVLGVVELPKLSQSMC